MKWNFTGFGYRKDGVREIFSVIYNADNIFEAERKCSEIISSLDINLNLINTLDCIKLNRIDEGEK